jgi:hypothetical protein
LAEKAGLRPPSECRRGNCLSCTAKLAPGSSANLVTDEGTFLCAEAVEQGYVLLCSSYATGPGLVLELEKMSEACQVQYYDRFTTPKAENLRASASAQAVTGWAVRNPAEWKEATAGQFEDGGGSSNSAKPMPNNKGR